MSKRESLESNNFDIQLVKDKFLLDKVQYLRGRVFFDKEEKDEDVFDEFCDHLAVVDKRNGLVVGTYRLLLSSVAAKHQGFYSETEFDLANIKKNCSGELLEMCRACVLESYRKYHIINLLWKEIISYFAKYKVRYVFGCPSIENPSPQTIGKIFNFFKENYFAPESFRVEPLKNKIYHYDKNTQVKSPTEAYRLLPSLIRGYLKMGAVACSEPAWDKDFGTADFFMLLDTSRMNEAYKMRFTC